MLSLEAMLSSDEAILSLKKAVRSQEKCLLSREKDPQIRPRKHAMPELPDIDAYIQALESRILNLPILEIRVLSPFLIRSVDPPIGEAVGKRVTGFRRLGKRIVFELDDDLFLIFHLMIAGRFHWKDKPSKPTRNTLAVFAFESGTLMLTEAGSKKRASLYLARGEAALASHDPGGLEVLDADFESFRGALTR